MTTTTKLIPIRPPATVSKAELVFSLEQTKNLLRYWTQLSVRAPELLRELDNREVAIRAERDKLYDNLNRRPTEIENLGRQILRLEEALAESRRQLEKAVTQTLPKPTWMSVAVAEQLRSKGVDPMTIGGGS